MKLKVIHNFPISTLVFFAFNFFLMLICASYLGIGGWLVVAFPTEKQRIPLIKEYYLTMGILMLIVGGICGILSFFGYLLTLWRKVPLLITYVVGLVLVFLLGIAIGIVGFVYANYVETGVNKALTEDIFLSLNPKTVQLVDAIHTDYKCCGLNGSFDWANWLNEKIPASCCSSKKDTCSPNDAYQTGCLKKVKASMFTDMVVSGALSIAIILPTILGMISAIALIIELVERSDYRMSKA